MGRLVWTETRDGWQSGQYLIELAAPRLWVLSQRPKHDDGGVIMACRVIRTGGSLREMKRVAAELEHRLERRRRIQIHLAITVAFASVAVLSALLGWGIAIPAVVVMFAIALRTLVMWVEGATGSAWSVLSEHYQ